MANKIANAALQYSKWLSRFICWVWAMFRFFVLIASVIEPSAAEHLASTIVGIDTIMLANVSTYLINSLGEKWIYSDRMVMAWIKKGGFNSLIHKASDLIKDAVEDDEEEGNNG